MGSALNRNLGDCEPRSAQPKRLEFLSHCPGHAVRGNDPKPSFAIHRTSTIQPRFSAVGDESLCSGFSKNTRWSVKRVTQLPSVAGNPSSATPRRAMKAFARLWLHLM